MANMLADLENLIVQGDAAWISWFGDDKSLWPFDTQCCATEEYRQMATCPQGSTATIL